ncbi:MAG: MaoC/PaaZ C-terminal domain-containing protein, partial [Actinomycetia bacterium]|nr:MaoC/PaaZ C-terminal domain-containing protein [Actinomycetes bacterium]
FNPIHHSAWAAAQLGLPGVLAHGMLTMGLALRVVTAWAGPAAVRRYSARFTKPVVVPDDGLGAELHLTGQVTAVGEDSVTVSIDATCNGEKVLGQAVVEVAR